MNVFKKILKKDLFLIVVLPMLVSCAYDDSDIISRLSNLEARMDKLESLCKEYNTNIISLQTIVSALQSEDHIISIVDIMKDGEAVGCVITFEKNGSITIYYSTTTTGESAPIISVAKDTDDIYYWTVNGTWLIVDGHKVRAEGYTPLLKVENGFWWVSYDNGISWVALTSASGTSGGNGMFQSVTYDENYAYFTLSDGTIFPT